MGKAGLRAVVIGAGWAGEGLTRALRNAGVEVVALCARDPEITATVAARLEVPEASTDWQSTLDRRRPDIVALGTPAALRERVVEKAVALGCNILCEKPLATAAPEAGRMYRLVRDAGVKHAFAATQRYDPSVAWLAELVRERVVGPLQEIVLTLRMGRPSPPAWSWMCTLAAGGGLMNQGLTHWFGILERIAGGELTHVMGEAQVVIDRAPVIPGIHDFRVWRESHRQVAAQGAAGNSEWRECDSDGAVSALCRFQAGDRAVPATILIRPGTGVPQEGNGMRLYGESGTLVAAGLFHYAVSRVSPDDPEPHPLPIPDRLEQSIPQADSDEQRKWNALVLDFVADIEGRPHAPYLTFRDGWRYQQAIDAIRSGQGWTQLQQVGPGGEDVSSATGAGEPHVEEGPLFMK